MTATQALFEALTGQQKLPQLGPDGVKRFMGEFREGFPDFHTTIENQIAGGDKVVT